MFFKTTLKLRKKQIIPLAQAIAIAVCKSCQQYSIDKKINNLEIPKDDLPPEAEYLSYDILPFLEETFWSAQRQKIAEDLFMIEINASVKRKEGSYLEYKKKVDEVILIVVEGFVPRSWFALCREVKSSIPPFPMSTSSA